MMNNTPAEQLFIAQNINNPADELIKLAALSSDKIETVFMLRDEPKKLQQLQ